MGEAIEALTGPSPFGGERPLEGLRGTAWDCPPPRGLSTHVIQLTNLSDGSCTDRAVHNQQGMLLARLQLGRTSPREKHGQSLDSNRYLSSYK